MRAPVRGLVELTRVAVRDLREPGAGRVEPRFDRGRGTLEVLGAWGDTSRLAEAMESLAEFLDARLILPAPR